MRVVPAPPATPGAAAAGAEAGAPVDGATAGFEALLAALVAPVPAGPLPPTVTGERGTVEPAPVGTVPPAPVTGKGAVPVLPHPGLPTPVVEQPTAQPTEQPADQPLPAAPAAPDDSAPASPAPAPSPPPVTAPAAPTVTAPVTAPVAAPTLAAPVADAPPTPGPAPVARQVFDGIEKLTASSTPQGTHRLTLRLDPGTLGEVRVHLTVREGQVQVRLGAGAEARAALREGAPELQRLLQARGAEDVRIAVHRLEPTATAAATTTAAPAASTAQASQPAAVQPPPPTVATDGVPHHDLLGARTGSEWSGQQAGQPGAHAGTRRATDARDGDQDRVHGPTSAEPRASRPYGVDVRM